MEEKMNKILEKVDSGRRGFLKNVLKASFAAPVIATFSLEALSVESAQAFIGNQTLTENCAGPLPDVDNAPFCTEFLFQSPFNS